MLACASPLAAQSDGALDTKFVFRLLLFSEGDRLGLSADVTSTSTYPCAGFGIKVQQLTHADTITIHVGGMLRPNPCFQTSEVATGKFFIGPLSMGKYVLKIYYRGVSDVYSLNVERSRFALAPLRTEFTEMEKL
jgi:hypothetical protein